MPSNSIRRWQETFGSSDILLLVVACLLCIVQVVQPFMSDHEIYARGGKALLDGGHLYTDFIDVKPPLIYELFALCMSVFGMSTMALRSMDVVLELVALVLIFMTVYEHTRSRFAAHGASLAFGAYMASLWMPSTLQPETLAILPLVLLIRIGAKTSASRIDALVLGALAGILLMLKYPLILPALPVIWAFTKRSEHRSTIVSLVIVALTSVVVVVFGIVWYDGIIAALQQVVAFVSGYSSSHGGIPELVAGGLDNVTDFIANDTSLLLTTCALTAVIAAMVRGKKRDPLFVTTVTVLVALALSIIVERKFNTAHMPRLLPAMAILAGYGLPIVWLACVRAWRNQTFSIPVLLVMATIAIILSPLPRVARSTGAFAMVVAQRMSLSEAPNISRDGFIDRFGMDSAIAAVKADNPQSLVVLGVGGTLMYWYVPDVRKSKFADAHFFTAPYAPQAWKAEALREAEQTDVLVLQDDDFHPRLTGHRSTTSEVLMHQPEWVALFERRRRVFDDGNMSVWTRR